MNHRQSLNRLVVLVGLVVGLRTGLPAAHAASYTWTNTANTASDFWTNGVNWGTQTTNSPGSAPGSSAYLTNQLSGTYTNILDTALANTVNLLAISNALGEVWLVVTNNGTGLTNSIFKLGSGGRVEINNGGVIAGITNFTWVGTNGAIILNAGGKLFTATGITIDSSTTGLVSSISAAGQGGVWNLNSNALTVGSAQSFNSVTINNATLTNVGTVTIGAGANSTGNSLTLSNGASFFSGNVTIGNASGASNNAYNVGGFGAASMVSNGAITVGGAGAGFNTMTVTNANAWSAGLTVGNGSSNNTVSVFSNVTWNMLGGAVLIGTNSAYNNKLVVNGGTITNAGAISIGSHSVNGTPGADSNSLTISNGGSFFGGAVIVGNGGQSGWPSLNAYNVGGLGAISTVSNGTIDVALYKGTGNTLTVTNANFMSGALYVGRDKTGEFGAGAYGNASGTVTVLTNATWNMLGNTMYIGFTNSDSVTGKGNSMTINGGIVTNVGVIGIGTAVNGVNSLTISNGGSLFSRNFTVGWATGSNSAYNVGGFGALSTVSNGTITVGSAANGVLGRLTVTNANLWSTGLIIGANGSSSNAASVFTNVTWNMQGGAVNVGNAANARSNAFTITDGTVSNVGTVTVGSGVGSAFNMLTITNTTLSTSGPLNLGNASSSNTVTVLGNSTWNLLGNNVTVGHGTATGNVLTVGSGGLLTNINLLTIGYGGTGNRLTISSGGTVNASAVTVSAGNSATLSGTLGGGTLLNYGTVTVGNNQTFTFIGTSFINGAAAALINPSGWLSMSGVNSSFVLTSGSSSNSFNFSGGTLQFSAATASSFQLAGQNFGPDAAVATNNNYFIGTLALAASGGTLTLSGGSALYVGNLTLASGSTLDLQGRAVYYDGILTTNGATINFAGGQFIPLSDPVPTTITLTPASGPMLANRTRQFTASVVDQFGWWMPVSFSWSVSGGGSIDTNGLFTAGGTAGGPYTVTASAGGTNGTATVTVTIDQQAPAIALNGRNPQSIEVNGTYVEAGAIAVDDWDGDLTSSIQINASAVNTSVLGTYQVLYSVADLSGNMATSYRTVIVHDTTPPVPHCQDQTFAASTNNCVATNIHFTTSFTDNYYPTVAVITDFAQGQDLTPGTYPVHATATDGSGNTTNCTFNLIVTGAGCSPTVATPTFSPVPASGTTYTHAVAVTITCPTPGATIYYTTDGTDPTPASAGVPAGNLVVLGMDTTLQAKAWKSGLLPSATRMATYSINPGMIAAGSDTILALRADEMVWSYQTAAVMRAGLTNIVKITANADGHYLALTDLGTLWAWGTNSTGQLGDGTTIDRAGPVSIAGLTNLAAIAAGEAHSLAADKTGRVWAWGSDEFGQLGDGLTNVIATAPQFVGGLSNVNAVVVAAGGAHSLALDISGIVWAWGLNTSGQAGQSSLTNIALPGSVAGLTQTIVAVAAGYQHSLALGTNGVLWAWGANDHGQLGNGTTTNTATPVMVTAPPTNVVAIASGDAHSLALDGTGGLWAWGDNTYGQLGNGTNGDQWVPQLVAVFSNNVVAIAVSGNLSAALRADGTIWAWGQCVSALSGDLTNGGTNVPVQLPGFLMGAWIDSDGDGMPDGWEIANGLNPYDPMDANQDPDGDGLSNLQEYLGGTDPHDYYNGVLPTLTVTNGNNQSGVPNQFLSQPLAVIVRTSGGAPLPNAPVNFTVTQGTGLLASSTNGTCGSSVLLGTDANGLAQVWFQSSSTGATTNQITLTAISGMQTTQAIFTVWTQPPVTSNPLPDWWQIQYFGHTGVDPNADPDGDGLSNLQEYLLGTNPTVAEAGPSGTVTTVVTVNGADAQGMLGRWQVDGTSIYAVDRRGYVEYTINAPAADIYRLEIVGTAHQYIQPVNNYPLQISIDGEFVSQPTLVTTGGVSGVVDTFTPWLTNGSHTVRLFWDGASSYESLAIRELRLQTIAGADTNTNAVKDWVEYYLAKRNAIFSNQLTVASYTSPYCLEGKGQYVSMMALTVEHTSSLAPYPSPNDHWYANVPLSATNTTTVVATFENGGTTSTQQVQWVARNVLDGGTITIRKGDSLLLTAAPAGVTNGSVQLCVSSNQLTLAAYSSTPASPVPHCFTAAGIYTVRGVYTPAQGAPQGGTLTVQVVAHAFTDSPVCWVDYSRTWAVTGLPTGAVLQADTRLQAADVVSNGTHTLTLAIDQNQPRYVVSRVSPDGPILATVTARGVTIARSYLVLVEVYPDGSQLYEMGLVESSVQPDVTVQLNISAGGITFDDGNTRWTVDPEDFDELGQFTVRFLRQVDGLTSICHTIIAYQGNTRIGGP